MYQIMDEIPKESFLQLNKLKEKTSDENIRGFMESVGIEPTYEQQQN